MGITEDEIKKLAEAVLDDYVNCDEPYPISYCRCRYCFHSLDKSGNGHFANCAVLIAQKVIDG